MPGGVCYGMLFPTRKQNKRGEQRMRIAVIGYSAGGKSTLAARLGALYGIEVLHLDRVYFSPGWKQRDPEEAKSLVRAFMAGDSWIIDGNFGGLFLKERLELADRILFLSFNRFSCLFRAVARYFKYRGKTRESVAEGCPEKLDFEFIRWILFAGRTKEKQRHYAGIVEVYGNKTIVLKNQKELDGFYASLAPGKE